MIAVGQAKEGVSNESSVYIGIKENGYEIPSLTAPQGGYTVLMEIEHSARDLSEDYKSKETEFASWLLRIEINDVYANPNDSDYYPELHWDPDEFCPKGHFRLWSSNAYGELLSLIIEDMRSEQNYRTKDEDEEENLWYLITFMIHREICGDNSDNNYDGLVDEGCAPYYLDKDAGGIQNI